MKVRRLIAAASAAVALGVLTVASPASAQVSPPTSANLRVVAQAPAADPGLAKTGSDSAPLAAVGAGLAAVGAGLVVVARRRSSAAPV
jgi:LPXTG-motif cell wall-anchored protein